jgi:hypothetical protein
VTYTTTAEAERLDCGLFHGPTRVAYADTSLPVGGMTRRGIVVGGGGGSVVGGHIAIKLL